MTLLERLKLKGPLAHSIRGCVADHLSDLVFFIAGFDCFVESFPVWIFFEFRGAEGFPIAWAFAREGPFVLHLLTEYVKRDEGMGFDSDRKEFSVFARPSKMRHDESLGAALVALNEGVAGRRDINIEGFFIWVLEISSIGAEELTRGETKASGPGDLEGGQTVDVWLWHFVRD